MTDPQRQHGQPPASSQSGPLAALTAGQLGTLACLLEVTAPKPGNVHRGADFEDLAFEDFVVSAVAIGPALDAAVSQGVGRSVLEAVRASRACVPTNVHLGTVLLLAPLAAVPRDQELEPGLPGVLDRLTADDSRLVYAAIRLAQPGGLGRVAEMDVADEGPVELLAAMRAAAERDLVARQYADGYHDVFQVVLRDLVAGRQQGWSLDRAIIHAQLTLMSAYPDSLIARKCGLEVARQSSARAAAVLAAGEPGSPAYLQALADLDFWLRSDGHRRNPGTTADLVAAGLFAGLRGGRLQPPFHSGFHHA